MTDGFKVGTGLKQGEGLASDRFNIALGNVEAIVGTNRINSIS